MAEIDEYSVLAEIEFAKFDEEGKDWEWCKQHAAFQHKEACEFIIHIGDDAKAGLDNLHSEINSRIRAMKSFGCSDEFIQTYIEAAKKGARRVLFWR